MESPIQDKLQAVALNIRDHRLLKNYSQEYLAACLDISQKAFSRIELGYTKITIERLYKIAESLGISIMELLKIPA